MSRSDSTFLMRSQHWLAAGMLWFAACTVSTAHADTFRLTAQSDVQSWDVHSHNHSLHNTVHSYVYESLVGYDSRSMKLKPVLAERWSRVSPTLWRFEIRAGVRFQDGSILSAEDVVFSLRRAMLPQSAYQAYTKGIESVEQTGKLQVEIRTTGVLPTLKRQLTQLRIMSKAWAVQHDAEQPAAVASGRAQQAYTFDHAMGTGAYEIAQWQPQQKLTLRLRRDWWGHSQPSARVAAAQVDQLELLPIATPAARVAALRTGAVDMVLDPAPQDIPALARQPQFVIANGLENRTIMLGVLHNKPPFDQLALRKALYAALDLQLLEQRVLNGMAESTSTIVAPSVNGWNASLQKPHAQNMDVARKELAEAGFDGINPLPMRMLCPSDRYVLDVPLCNAIAAMWSRAGVNVQLRTLPMNLYIPALQRDEADVFLLGWGVPTLDAQYTLNALVHSRGAFNLGHFRDPQIDALIDRAGKELDPATRTNLLTQALDQTQSRLVWMPLFHQKNPWALRSGITIAHRPDNVVDPLTVVFSPDDKRISDARAKASQGEPAHHHSLQR